MLAETREIIVEGEKQTAHCSVALEMCKFHFQPIFCLRTNEVVMYEALLRAPIGSEGSIEDLVVGLISVKCEDSLTRFTLDSVKRHLLNPAMRDITFTLNMEPAQIASEEFESIAVEFFKQNNIDKQRVIFEITERPCSHLIFSRMIKTVNTMNTSGYSFAIDDFGTGVSNFEMLSSLDVKLVKLDGTFGMRAISHKNSEKVLRLAATLKDKFDCKVCVEGLETEQHIALAKQLGFCLGQGYGLGRPAPLN